MNVPAHRIPSKSPAVNLDQRRVLPDPSKRRKIDNVKLAVIVNRSATVLLLDALGRTLTLKGFDRIVPRLNSLTALTAVSFRRGSAFPHLGQKILLRTSRITKGFDLVFHLV